MNNPYLSVIDPGNSGGSVSIPETSRPFTKTIDKKQTELVKFDEELKYLAEMKIIKPQQY